MFIGSNNIIYIYIYQNYLIRIYDKPLFVCDLHFKYIVTHFFNSILINSPLKELYDQYVSIRKKSKERKETKKKRVNL